MLSSITPIESLVSEAGPVYFPGRDFPTQSPAGDYKEVPCHHVRIHPYAGKGCCLGCPCPAVQLADGRVPELETAHWTKQAPNSG